MREQLDAGDVRRALDAALSPLLAQHSGEGLAALVMHGDPTAVAITAAGASGRVVLARYAVASPQLAAAVEDVLAGLLAAHSDAGDLAFQAADTFAVRLDLEQGDVDAFVVGANLELVHIGRVCDGAVTLH